MMRMTWVEANVEIQKIRARQVAALEEMEDVTPPRV
jgi:hypothetical protein